MAQRNIDFGTFPDDPSADAIRTAFTKVQENFTQLFSGLQDQAVLSVNQTAGAGISVNSPTGNVIVTANLACVQVSTSTLSIGQGANGGQTAVITQSAQTLFIDLPPNIANVTNIAISGTLIANTVNANLQVNGNVGVFSGNITGANLITGGVLVVTGNANLGNVGAATGLFTSNVSVSNILTAGNVFANSGTISASLLTGTLTTNAQPNVTSVGTLTSLAVTGNVIAANMYANSGTIGASLLNGTLTTNAQPNVTSVGTLTSLNVVGTTTGAAFTANTGVFTGNGNGLSSLVGANVTCTVANATYAASAGSAGSSTTAVTVTANAQPNITSTGTLTSLDVNGNITAANITANTGVFTGNGNGLSAINASNISTGTLAQARLANDTVTLGSTALTLGNTVTTVAGLTSVTSTTFVGALTGAATTAGSVTTNAQSNITSVGTLTSLTVTGNVTGGNASLGNLITANFFNGNGSLLTALTGANVTGTVANATYAVSAGTAGTVTANAQPNITSTGTLTS